MSLRTGTSKPALRPFRSKEAKSYLIGDSADGMRRSIAVAVERPKKHLASLSPMQRSVVECRLIQAPLMTRAEVGPQVGRTRKRIRQIQIGLGLRISQAIGN